jgi:hypothetical protein
VRSRGESAANGGDTLVRGTDAIELDCETLVGGTEDQALRRYARPRNRRDRALRGHQRPRNSGLQPVLQDQYDITQLVRVDERRAATSVTQGPGIV